MTIDETKPEISIDKTILWQYDKSHKLIALVTMIKSFADALFSNNLDSLIEYGLKLDNAGTEQDPLNGFGLDLWGVALGLKRPSRMVGQVAVPISNDAYRKILKARFALVFSNADGASLRKFMYDVFGSNATIIDNGETANNDPETAASNVMTVSLASNPDMISDPDISYIASDPEIIMSIIKLPSGVGMKDTAIHQSGTFGLNVSDKRGTYDSNTGEYVGQDTTGQNLENFATTQSDNFGGTFES